MHALVRKNKMALSGHLKWRVLHLLEAEDYFPKEEMYAAIIEIFFELIILIIVRIPVSWFFPLIFQHRLGHLFFFV